MSTPIARLRREDALLLVVDVQERLLPAMFEAERVARQCALLARTAQQFTFPVVATEQYPEKLGATIAPLAQLLQGCTPVSKMLFSACTPAVMSNLQNSGRRSVILCGLETHVCVMQTALDLVQNGFTVFVPQDAVSSRYESDKRIGLERMRNVGVVPCSTEMVVFELLREAGTPDFKVLLPFIK
ncbi:MAG TPA: isochorismatase family protein [Abditibacteriaceae bacterium]|jgi:nicotinamidase-related amidase